MQQLARDGERRGAGIEQDGLSVGDHGRGGRADEALGGGVFLRAAEELKLERNVIPRARAAMRANNFAALGQAIEIPADGHVTDRQFAREFFDAALAALENEVDDPRIAGRAFCV